MKTDTKIEKKSNNSLDRIKRVPEKVWLAWKEIIDEHKVATRQIASGTKLTEPTVRVAVNNHNATNTTQWAITAYLSQVVKNANEDLDRQLEALSLNQD